MVAARLPGLAPGQAGTFDVNLVAPDGPDLVPQFDAVADGKYGAALGNRWHLA